MNELELSEDQIKQMISETARNMAGQIAQSTIKVAASDSFGDHNHRTWAFCLEDSYAFGTIERYWGGLKMICSVLGGAPRTSFFTENGIRSTNKGLREQPQSR